MITREKFNEIITSLLTINTEVDTLYDMGIDMIESHIFIQYGKMVDIVLDSLYTKEGQNLINWWLYEVPLNKDLVKIWDDKGEEIKCETIEDLWELTKKYRK